MKRISLHNTLPMVFASEEIPASEVWLQQLEFEKGNSYLIRAASGGGKSSLCSFVYGVRKDFKGSIQFDDVDISKLSMDEWLAIRREHLAYLPQELSLFPELSAMENVLLKNRLTDFATEVEISRWFDMLGLSMRKDYPVGRMSVGQQQRVAIIRSICQPFDFILLDEPVSHLDIENNGVAAKLISDAVASQGAGVISTSVGNHLMLDYTKTVAL